MECLVVLSEILKKVHSIVILCSMIAVATLLYVRVHYNYTILKKYITVAI